MRYHEDKGRNRTLFAFLALLALWGLLIAVLMVSLGCATCPPCPGELPETTAPPAEPTFLPDPDECPQPPPIDTPEPLVMQVQPETLQQAFDLMARDLKELAFQLSQAMSFLMIYWFQ